MCVVMDLSGVAKKKKNIYIFEYYYVIQYGDNDVLLNLILKILKVIVTIRK